MDLSFILFGSWRLTPSLRPSCSLSYLNVLLAPSFLCWTIWITYNILPANLPTNLDVRVLLMNEKLETDLCVHPTGKHQYLLKSSCHSSQTKYSNSFSTEHAHGPSSIENLINTTKGDPDEGYFSLTEILGNLIQILSVRSALYLSSCFLLCLCTWVYKWEKSER